MAARISEGVGYHSRPTVSFQEVTVLILDRMSGSINGKALTKVHYSTFKSTKAATLTINSANSMGLIFNRSVIHL